MLSINSKALVLLTLAATSAMPVLAVESNKDKLIASTLTQIHSFMEMTSTQDVSVFLHDAELNYAIAAISVGLSDAHQDMLSEMLEAHAGHKDINKEIRLLKVLKKQDTHDLQTAFEIFAQAQHYFNILLKHQIGGKRNNVPSFVCLIARQACESNSPAFKIPVSVRTCLIENEYIPCSSESSCTVNAHTCDNDECYDNESSFVDQDDCCGNEDIDFQYAVKPSLDAQTFKAHTIKFVCDNIELPLIQNIFIILARIQLLNIDDIDQDEIIAALTQEDIAHLNAFYQALDKQLTEQA